MSEHINDNNEENENFEMPDKKELKARDLNFKFKTNKWFRCPEASHKIIFGQNEGKTKEFKSYEQERREILQEKMDKVNSLFELGIYPKYDEVGNNVQAIFTERVMQPNEEIVHKSDLITNINQTENDFINYLDAYEKNKSNPPKEYPELSDLILDLNKFVKASDINGVDSNTGFKGENRTLIKQINEKLTSANLRT